MLSNRVITSSVSGWAAWHDFFHWLVDLFGILFYYINANYLGLRHQLLFRP
jgi:hypothetical protein